MQAGISANMVDTSTTTSEVFCESDSDSGRDGEEVESDTVITAMIKMGPESDTVITAMIKMGLNQTPKKEVPALREEKSTTDTDTQCFTQNQRLIGLV